MHFDKFLTNDTFEDRHIDYVAPLTTFCFLSLKTNRFNFWNAFVQ